MASDGREDDAITITVPPGVDDWLDEQAMRRGESRADVCRRLLRAAHTISADDEVGDLPDASDVESLRTRIDAQREEFIDHVEDVRERVVQVKRETDDRAPREHDHDRYADTDAVDDLAADVEALESSLETLAERVDEEFDDFESILGRLSADLEQVSDRSTVLASAVLDLRDTRARLVERDSRRAAAEELKLAANRLGVRSATCEACESSVDVALLTKPTCPHCDVSIADVERRSSILGSHTLVAGDPPALPGSTDSDGPERDRLEAAADAESTSGGETDD